MRTLAHNTMLVDMQNHFPGNGHKLVWDVEGMPRVASAGSDQLAEDVWMERNVVMFPGAVLLIDALVSDRQRTYDWAYHNVGSRVAGPELSPAEPLAEDGPYSYLLDLEKGGVDETWSVEFRQEASEEDPLGRGLKLTQLGVPGTQLFGARTGHGHGHNRMASTLLSRRTGKRAVYVTLLEPLAEGVSVSAYAMQGQTIADDTVSVSVTVGDRRWDVRVNLGSEDVVKTPKVEVKDAGAR
ncbi:MAG: hypothetical protein K9N51_00960 [Candidatus Pacebacteria bacterium]|nr:hypothetical protein [Candidatus Paceibacterota bacterium]